MKSEHLQSNNYSTEQVRDRIIAILDDRKAEHITVIDTRNKTSIAKYMIFATGRSTKHVSSVADYVSLTIKNEFSINNNVEGMLVGDWVIIDASDVVVNVFCEEVRAMYALEEFINSRVLD